MLEKESKLRGYDENLKAADRKDQEYLNRIEELEKRLEEQEMVNGEMKRTNSQINGIFLKEKGRGLTYQNFMGVKEVPGVGGAGMDKNEGVVRNEIVKGGNVYSGGHDWNLNPGFKLNYQERIIN